MPFPDQAFFDQVYLGRAPWDIGAAQPDLTALLEEFPPHGRILDLGCGTGDLAIALAQAGHRVLGVDFAPAAIDVARERAAAIDPPPSAAPAFEVADALRPSRWAGAVGAVVDSGFYHLFDAEPRRALVRELAATLPPGGRYYMLAFAVALPAPDVPRQVTAAEIEASFAPEQGWIVRAARPARFLTVGFDAIPALAVCAERGATAAHIPTSSSTAVASPIPAATAGRMPRAT